MSTPDTLSDSPVSLLLLPAPALQAMLDGDLGRASTVVGIDLPPCYLDHTWLWRLRLDQVTADPSAAPWLVRAVIARNEHQVVGHAGFHGPPDPDGMVEIGYSILPESRRRGYGRAAARELIRFAAEVPAVRVVRASISPDNVASLALVRSLGFHHVGEQWDDEDGRELIFERPLQEDRDAGV